jgi:hypothetical protein
MNDREKRRRRRERAAIRKFGIPNPACEICGETALCCLEWHEPGGRRFNKVRVILCRNCHRKLEDDRRDHPKPIWKSDEPIQSLAFSLYGEADILSRLAAKRREDAEMLLKLSARDAIEPEEGRP